MSARPWVFDEAQYRNTDAATLQSWPGPCTFFLVCEGQDCAFDGIESIQVAVATALNELLTEAFQMGESMEKICVRYISFVSIYTLW